MVGRGGLPLPLGEGWGEGPASPDGPPPSPGRPLPRALDLSQAGEVTPQLAANFSSLIAA